MKTLRFLSLLLITATLWIGCSTTGSPTSDSRPVLAEAAGSTWKLDSWTRADGGNQDTGPITLNVAKENRLSGNASVNRYMGQAKFNENGTLNLSSGFASTMMMGQADAMDRERRYLSDLKEVHSAKLENQRLILSGSGSLRLEYIKTKN